MSTDQTLAIGVDLGATKIASALVRRDGSVLKARQTPTRAGDGAEAVCQRIANEVKALLADAPAGARVSGVGIGSPGLIDSAEGIVRLAVNLNWDDVPLAAEVAQRVGGKIPVYVENDANVNALGEGLFGSAAGSKHFVLFTIGSGLGSGVVSHGRIVTGATWIAADLGHYAIDPDHGRQCVCGNVGCAETVVSGPGLVAVTRSMLAGDLSSEASELRDVGELTPDIIEAAARRNDPIARGAIAMMSTWLGEIAAVAAAVINPDIIVIGGGFGMAAFDLLAADTEREMYRRLPPHYRGSIQLRRATLTSPAVGSAGIVWSRLDHAAE
jgi:glucokinase